VYKYGHAHLHVHQFSYSSSCISTFVLKFFLISMVEEWSQPTKHANKILVSIFLTMKATTIVTHGITLCENLIRKNNDSAVFNPCGFHYSLSVENVANMSTNNLYSWFLISTFISLHVSTLNRVVLFRWLIWFYILWKFFSCIT